MVKKLEQKKCEWCGKKFEAYKKEQQFCSRACSQAFKSSNKIKKVCCICGQEFEAIYDNTKYCSDRCRGVFIRIKYDLNEQFNNKAISLIRYGQQNPFTKATALWGVFQAEYKGKFEDDECVE